ncbi:hypothetical protein HZA97_09700 [Candidatus Woesearchaeota archaeon]|nr:hypothetical protein [Candidatus Woesearchaeota archaeon]
MKTGTKSSEQLTTNNPLPTNNNVEVWGSNPRGPTTFRQSFIRIKYKYNPMSWKYWLLGIPQDLCEFLEKAKKRKQEKVRIFIEVEEFKNDLLPDLKVEVSLRGLYAAA